MANVFFFHGLEGNPNGNKATLLKSEFPHIVIPALPPGIRERHKIIEDLVTSPSLLIGSSLGGLSAILFAMKYPHLVTKLLLLAPVVDLRDTSMCTDQDLQLIQQTYVPEKIPCVIIAAIHDEIIPLSSIEKMKAKSSTPTQIQLIKVQDHHGLGRSMNIIINQARKLVSSKSPTL